MSDETNCSSCASAANAFKPVEIKKSRNMATDADLIASNHHGQIITMAGNDPEDVHELLKTLKETINKISQIQHARMTRKGFYNSFWSTRNLLLKEVLRLQDEYDDPLTISTKSEVYDQLAKACERMREHTVNFIIKQLGLICEETGEAMSAVRENNKRDDKLTHRLGVEVEGADIFIRLVDLAGFMNLDLGGAIVEKMGFNETRPYMHGKQA